MPDHAKTTDGRSVPNGALSVNLELQGSTARVAPVGDLDLATNGELERVLRDLQGKESIVHLVLDLRGLRFLDSTGLATIIRADAAARRDGFNMALIKAPPNVHRVFVLSGLDRHLVIVDEPDELVPPEGRSPSTPADS